MSWEEPSLFVQREFKASPSPKMHKGWAAIAFCVLVILGMVLLPSEGPGAAAFWLQLISLMVLALLVILLPTLLVKIVSTFSAHMGTGVRVYTNKITGDKLVGPIRWKDVESYAFTDIEVSEEERYRTLCLILNNDQGHIDFALPDDATEEEVAGHLRELLGPAEREA